MDFRGAAFHSPGATCIDADGSRVSGSVFLDDDFISQGQVSIGGAFVGGGVFCSGTMLNDNLTCLNLQHTEILGPLVWKPKSFAGSVDFANLSAQMYSDDLDLTSVGKYSIVGFKFQRADHASVDTLAERLKWLRSSDDGTYHPQPYEQWIRFFKQEGFEEGAREVAIQKLRCRRRHAPFVRRCAEWMFLDLLVGYGYKPWKALFAAALIVAIGSVYFQVAFNNSWLGRAKEQVRVGATQESYPRFYSVAYTLDLFLPLVDLRQADYWIPSHSRQETPLWIATWAEVGFGWVLSTLFLSAVTGVVRRE